MGEAPAVCWLFVVIFSSHAVVQKVSARVCQSVWSCILQSPVSRAADELYFQKVATQKQNRIALPLVELDVCQSILSLQSCVNATSLVILIG